MGVQQQHTHTARQRLGRSGPVDLSDDGRGITAPCIHVHRAVEQRSQVVGQHLHGHIHQQGMLTQTADTLQTQTVLEAVWRRVLGRVIAKKPCGARQFAGGHIGRIV